MQYMEVNETHGEKSRWELRKNDRCCFEKHPKSATVRQLTSHLKLHSSKANKKCRTALEKQGQTQK